MQHVHITLSADEHADNGNVAVALTLNGEHVVSLVADPAAWRDLTAPVRALLGEQANAALDAAENAITQAVTEREQRGSEDQKHRRAAVKAWATIEPAPVTEP